MTPRVMRNLGPAVGAGYLVSNSPRLLNAWYARCEALHAPYVIVHPQRRRKAAAVVVDLTLTAWHFSFEAQALLEALLIDVTRRALQRSRSEASCYVSPDQAETTLCLAEEVEALARALRAFALDPRNLVPRAHP